MQNETPSERIYINGIAFLRTLAIFGIIIYHMFPHIMKGGFLGVSLFFLISGYLLAIRSEELRAKRKFSIPNFYKARVIRIYPQLFISVFVTAGAYRLLFPRALMGRRLEVLSIFLGVDNFWQISQNASYFARISNSSPYTHMWSLSTEMQYYLIWPVLFFIFIFLVIAKNKKTAANTFLVFAIITCLLMPIFYSPEKDVTRIYYSLDTRLFSFLTGAWLGFRKFHFDKEDSATFTNKALIRAVFLVLIIITSVMFVFVDGEAWYTYRGGMIVANIVFAGLIFVCSLDTVPIGMYLEKRVFRFFGEISFEMYLWMYSVIQIFYFRRWNKTFYAPFLEILIIVGLSIWLHYFVKLIQKKDFSLKVERKEKMQKIVLLQAGVIAAALLVLGCFSMTSSISSPSADNAVLQEELEEKAKALENQKLEESKPIEEDSVEIEEKEKVDYLSSVTTIGDSVMLGAAPALKEILEGSYVDAAESRQATAALDIIDELSAGGNLGRTVVIGLGTNGVITEELGQEIVDYLGDEHTIFWVNVYGETLTWMDEANSVIDKLVEANENVYLVDWASEAGLHREWLYDDGIHLRPEGQTGYATLVHDTIQTTQDSINEGDN